MIKIVYLITSCKKSGPIQQTLNIISNLDRSKFIPYLITIYDEQDDSVLDQFLPYVHHLFIKTDKLDILINRVDKLEECLNKIKPDLIHSLGIFPDFAVCRIKKYKQINTLRNYIYDDLISKFGRCKGNVLCLMSKYVMQRTSKTVTCSKSLSEIYEERMGIRFDYIRNGVDIEKYKPADKREKLYKRERMGISADCTLFVYSGQFIPRKNQEFLLKCFTEMSLSEDVILMLLGDGPEYERLKGEFGRNKNILFMGNVNNVEEYLLMCDVYISTSKSEGMPNGVIEAMASGLPYILSDIPQHREIYDVDHECGYLYREDDTENFKDVIQLMLEENVEYKSGKAVDVASKFFCDKRMSEEYQKIYSQVVAEVK